jgi:hypothetical protein
MTIETEVGKSNSKQRSILKGTSSKEHSEAESAPPAQKIRVEKNASSVLALNAPVLVSATAPATAPVSDLHPASAVAAAATVKAVGTGGAAGAGGKVVEVVKRSHQKGAGALHKKLLAAAQAMIPTLSDPLLTSSSSSSTSSSSSSSLLLPASSLTGTASVPSVCSRVALASILKGDPLTSITYQTFSGTNSCTCHRVKCCCKKDLRRRERGKKDELLSYVQIDRYLECCNKITSF